MYSVIGKPWGCNMCITPLAISLGLAISLHHFVTNYFSRQVLNILISLSLVVLKVSLSNKNDQIDTLKLKVLGLFLIFVINIDLIQLMV